MKSIEIKGSKRESVGKKSTKALRNAGEVLAYFTEGKIVWFIFTRQQQRLKV